MFESSFRGCPWTKTFLFPFGVSPSKVRFCRFLHFFLQPLCHQSTWLTRGLQRSGRGQNGPKFHFFLFFSHFNRISTKIEKSCSFSTCNCTVRKCTFEPVFREVDSAPERNGPISDQNKCWHHIREKKNYEKCFLCVSNDFDSERASGTRVWPKIIF